MNRDDKAEQILRTLIEQGGLRIIGVPEALPSAQEPSAIVLRVDIRVPAAVIDGTAVNPRFGESS